MSSVAPVNAAIVGLGRWGQALVSAVSGRPDAPLRFTRGVTRTPVKVAEFAGAHRLPVDDDFDAVLRDPDIDAVVLATPHSQHCSQICWAAAAGKHVFVEKPLALTLAEARRAVDHCARHDVLLAVGFNRRFLPAYRDLCTASEAGTLGIPLHVESNFSGPFGFHYRADMWRGTAAENPAGGMAAMGIHMLDAMIHLLGPVQSAATLSSRRAIDAPVDDTTTVQLAFQSGATGTLTTLMATAPHWRLQLFGSKGWAAMGDQYALETGLIGQDPVRRTYDVTNTLADELETFARSITGNGRYPVTMEEAMSGVAAMEAIARSAAADGERIAVAQV